MRYHQHSQLCSCFFFINRTRFKVGHYRTLVYNCLGDLKRKKTSSQRIVKVEACATSSIQSPQDDSSFQDRVGSLLEVRVGKQP